MRSRIAGWIVMSVMLVNNAWAMNMPWPLNGKLINQSAIPVAVWDGEQGIYTIPALAQSPSLLDVDHVYAANRTPVFLVYPFRSAMPRKHRVFIDFIVEALRARLVPATKNDSSSI